MRNPTAFLLRGISLFGGKELQTELDLGWSDFGHRCFDNWSTRWQGIDIMSEVTPQASPYGYTLGNPVRFSDPTGMLTEDENGMIQTSTSLWGRDASGGENTGNVLSSNFVSQGQLARDATTYKADGGGLQTGESNSLSSQFPALFGQVGYDGLGNRGGDGEIGFGESLIPVWGAGKMAMRNFEKGEVGWGIFNTVMAISDLALEYV